jgi:8-oxo-dGTP pyrophosphatase MutT (NUDIX family)
MESGIVNAVGVWFYSTSTDRYLYLLRNDPRHQNTWGLPGGKVEDSETLIKAIERECQEEMGLMPQYERLIPLEKFTSADTKFVYHTFFCTIDSEFIPTLNDEHAGWAWISANTWPKPLHPGLWSTVNFDVVQEKVNTLKRNYMSA